MTGTRVVCTSPPNREGREETVTNKGPCEIRSSEFRREPRSGGAKPPPQLLDCSGLLQTVPKVRVLVLKAEWLVGPVYFVS